MLKSKNQVETNKYELEIEVSAEAFEEALQRSYLKNKAKITINGFRPGKAPRKIIEKEYGEEVFFEDAVNDVYGPAIEEAVKEAELTLVAAPDVEVTEVSKAAGVKFKATCTTKPVVDIKDYKGITVKKTVNAVTDEAVEHEIGHMLEKNSRTISVDDRAAENGDDVVIDFEGFKDGVAFDGGKAEKFTLKLGSGQFIPGFEEQIVGKNIGDEFDVTVTFPENYQMEDYAGKEAVFKCKLNGITVEELPEVDDAFIQDSTEFETVDAFKADVRAKLEEGAERETQIAFDNAVIEALIAKVDAPIPNCMFEQRIDTLVANFENMLSQQGMGLDLYLQYTGMSIEDFRDSNRDRAVSEVKLRLALEKIAELENLEVSEEEIDKGLEEIATANNMTVADVKRRIPMADYVQDLRVTKAIDLVKESAVAEEAAAE